MPTSATITTGSATSGAKLVRRSSKGARMHWFRHRMRRRMTSGPDPGHVDQSMGALASRWKIHLTLTAAGLVAVSGGVHLRLYREQYRDVHVDRVLGVDLASSFVLSVAAATLVAILLTTSMVLNRGVRPAAVAGILYSAGAIVAYALSRSVGILGFEENRWIPEALFVKPIELAAVILLALALWPTPAVPTIRRRDERHA